MNAFAARIDLTRREAYVSGFCTDTTSRERRFPLGASAFTEFNVTDELLASAEGDPERYATLLAIKELKRLWDKRRRAEKKAKA